MKKFDYLIDLVEDTRHAFFAVRHYLTKDEAKKATEGTRALVEATQRKAEAEADDDRKELEDALYLQGQYEAAVTLFSFQNIV